MTPDFHRKSNTDQGETYVKHHAKAPSAGSALRAAGPTMRQATGLGRTALAAAFAVALVAFLGIGASAALAAPPIVTIEPATNVTATTAEVSGEVNPEGASTSWRFHYITADAYDENLDNSNPGFQGAATGPSGTTEATEPVAGELTGLQPGTRYHLRLLAESSEGSAEAVAPTFKTLGAAPLVKAWAAGPVSQTSADINAQINPQGSATVYWFEWGTQDCSANPCASIPVEHDASAGPGQIYVYVLRHLSGLQPETTYHFRVVAENDSGTTEGPDEEFTTAAPEPACTNAGMPGADFLPDCRAYEMVSPPDKNSADVIPQANKTHAAVDGNGAAFSAVGAFGDVVGTSTDVEYLSRRNGAPATNGWSTHAIVPPSEAPTLTALITSNFPSFESAFTPDLSAAIYRSWRPLTDAPNVADVANLYRVGNLDASEPLVQLLSPGAEPLAPLPPEFKLFFRIFFAGASTDLSHVIFQSPWSLTGDGGFSLPGNLYEYADGAGLRLVGRVPSGSDTACDDQGGPPCVDASSSQAGIPPSSSQYSTGMISDDGSRILFRVPSAGAVYMREDGERTYQLNASEKEALEEPGTAQVWAMSADGSRVFFTTSEGLIDGDNSTEDLYMYDVTAPAGSRLTLLSAGGKGDTSLVGTSADGHYVYFVDNGQLVPGEQPPLDRGLYLWHDDAISYIGEFQEGDDVHRNTPQARSNPITETKTSRVTPDGRFSLFMATNNEGFRDRGGFPGYDQGTTCTYAGLGACRELYLYSADTGRLRCVSCNPRSSVATGDAVTDIRASAGGSGITQHLSHALSNDGRRVFFNTTEALVPEDTNGKWDAYEYDVPSGAVHLLSSGTDKADSYFLEASPDGSDVFIATRERLVGWDVDSSYDLYDARVGGGFPEPAPVPAACEGESCLPPSPAAPGAAPTASQAAGLGNPKRKCPKGTRRVRRHGRLHCATKHKRKSRHRRERANDNRRAGR
jgi:hypothetical protein